MLAYLHPGIWCIEMIAQVRPIPPRQEVPTTVGSNQGKIEPERLGWLRPTSKDLPVDELRQRLHEDGYLFVKDLIPREDVLKVRKE